MKDNGSSESDEWKSRYDKLRAEFKDYIERSRREEEAKMAELRIDLAKKLLPVADSLTRVSAIYENSDNNNGCEVIRSYSENIRKNIEVIYDQLISAMSITPIEPAAGDKFDDRLHTAVGLEYGTIYPANSVFRVIRRGYRVGDNIVRPAEVIVSKRPLEAPAVRKARKTGLLERIARRVRPTKHRLIALNQRMDEFEHVQTDKLERLIQDVSTLKTKLEAGNQRLNELESTRAGAEEIAVIKEEIASLRAIIKELESRAEKVEVLAQDINSLRTTLEELEGRIAPLPLQGEVQSKYPSQETGYLKSGE
ncbi:MAG: nucleotide exchange factor GrpE [Methanophagales archaeon]|nr:nucleotide exchange factor GrpE [Methanophagales archaeon]